MSLSSLACLPAGASFFLLMCSASATECGSSPGAFSFVLSPSYLQE
jgi:hypothetical protein